MNNHAVRVVYEEKCEADVESDLRKFLPARLPRSKENKPQAETKGIIVDVVRRVRGIEY